MYFQGRFFHRVAMSVHVYVPISCQLFWGLSLALRSHDQIPASHWSICGIFLVTFCKLYNAFFQYVFISKAWNWRSLLKAQFFICVSISQLTLNIANGLRDIFLIYGIGMHTSTQKDCWERFIVQLFWIETGYLKTSFPRCGSIQ